MNIVLFQPEDLTLDDTFCLRQAQARQLACIKGLKPGSMIKAGVIGGDIHLAAVVSISSDEVVLKVDTEQVRKSPDQLPLTLVLALPRPQSLKKILQTVAELGVKRLILCGADRVQKSYFSSKVITRDCDSYLELGMQQAITTIKPEVVILPSLKEAIELTDVDSRKFIAHPGSAHSIEQVAGRSSDEQNITLAIGPEGGWSDRELAAFGKGGFLAICSGERILRCDTAVYVLVSQFALLSRLSKIN